MLLVIQIHASQDGGISLTKRFFGYAKSHLFEKYCSYLMSCNIYTPYIPGDPKKYSHLTKHQIIALIVLLPKYFQIPKVCC